MTAINEFKKLSGKLYINGNFRESAATDCLEVIDPDYPSIQTILFACCAGQRQLRSLQVML